MSVVVFKHPIKEFAIGAFLIFGAVFLLFMIFPSSIPEREGASVPWSSGVVVKSFTPITATDLAAEFEANEVRAESKYRGEKYRVSGRITDIGKEILGKPYLIIDNKVQAVFERGAAAAIARYDKGMQVTGNCEVGGKLVYVILRDCSL